jgi:hypothetical protein
MDGKNRQSYQVTISELQMSAACQQATPERNSSEGRAESALYNCEPMAYRQKQSTKTTHENRNGANDFKQLTAECFEVSDILSRIKGGQLLLVNGRRRNGLILYKGFHAEFAGPGAAVGGVFDHDCQQVISVGDLSLIYPDSHEERQKAYLIRRQWIRLTQQFTDSSLPVQRAQMILNQFENYFDPEMIAQIPDEAFALLVGVLPYTVKLARRPPGGGEHLKVKVKT